MRGNEGNADFAPEMTPFAPENMPFAPENGPHSPIPILATKGIIPIPAPRGMAPRGMTPLSRSQRPASACGGLLDQLAGGVSQLTVCTDSWRPSTLAAER